MTPTPARGQNHPGHRTDQDDPRDDLHAITGATYPLQRVTGISVTINPVTLTAVDGTPVPYQVYAQWPDGTNPTQILSGDTITGMETTLLLDLTGGTGLAAITLDTCDATTRTGICILARQPTATCHLHLRIGTLTTPDTTFTITMR
jgi:hypothetical protein